MGLYVKHSFCVCMDMLPCSVYTGTSKRSLAFAFLPSSPDLWGGGTAAARPALPRSAAACHGCARTPPAIAPRHRCRSRSISPAAEPGPYPRTAAVRCVPVSLSTPGFAHHDDPSQFAYSSAASRKCPIGRRGKQDRWHIASAQSPHLSLFRKNIHLFALSLACFSLVGSIPWPHNGVEYLSHYLS